MGAASNPCTGICRFSDGLCLSCGRLKSEKKQWKRLSKAERREIVARAGTRVAELGERAILSKKGRKKTRKKAKKKKTSESATVPTTTAPAAPVRVAPVRAAAPGDVVDLEAAKEARKQWKKARKLARKAKKAARKARAAEARARGGRMDDARHRSTGAN